MIEDESDATMVTVANGRFGSPLKGRTARTTDDPVYRGLEGYYGMKMGDLLTL